jgi:hypothetical protein
VSEVEPAEAEWNAWWAEGKAAAEQALVDSSSPIFLQDESGPRPQDTAKAMGWNSVWASQDNRRRFQHWRNSGASNLDSKTAERIATQLQKLMEAAAAVTSSTKAQD